MGLKVELVSADVPGTIRMLQSDGVILYETDMPDDLTVTFRIRRQDYNKVVAIAKRRGDSLRIVRRYGVYWKVISGLKRPLLVFGLLFFVLLPGFV